MTNSQKRGCRNWETETWTVSYAERSRWHVHFGSER